MTKRGKTKVRFDPRTHLAYCCHLVSFKWKWKPPWKQSNIYNL